MNNIYILHIHSNNDDSYSLLHLQSYLITLYALSICLLVAPSSPIFCFIPIGERHNVLQSDSIYIKKKSIFIIIWSYEFDSINFQQGRSPDLKTCRTPLQYDHLNSFS